MVIIVNNFNKRLLEVNGCGSLATTQRMASFHGALLQLHFSPLPEGLRVNGIALLGDLTISIYGLLKLAPEVY